jgi:hypothetical protein
MMGKWYSYFLNGNGAAPVVLVSYEGFLNRNWSRNRFPLVNKQNYGKSPFLVGKSTIKTPCSSSQTVSHYQRVTKYLWIDPQFLTIFVRKTEDSWK